MRDYFLWCFHSIILTPGYHMGILLLCGLLAVGWRPRVCGFLLFGMLLPLDFLRHGTVSRQVMLTALFIFSLIPSGTVRRPWKLKNRQQFIAAGPAWPIRLLQLLLTFLYGANAWAKSTEIYLRGEALMDMSLIRSNFNVDLSGGLFELGPLVVPVAVAATGSALIEYILAFGFWVNRLKWMVALLGVSFHFTLTFVVNIFMLHYAAIFLYLSFLLPLAPEKEKIIPVGD